MAETACAVSLSKSTPSRWSNNACRGYVIKAMESCGYKSKDIREVLIELYEVFDLRARLTSASMS
ncbi:hypothetical protein [uncultured Oscillibacter sp.]|uniref:hypothetical protein n=1 Tax=uncultured Oscillibacter sp. TaxID=876091 RepID=UPI00261343A7|nr:hypothetical protein [uncultured Oscillibacter sp.]